MFNFIQLQRPPYKDCFCHDLLYVQYGYFYQRTRVHRPSILVMHCIERVDAEDYATVRSCGHFCTIGEARLCPL